MASVDFEGSWGNIHGPGKVINPRTGHEDP